MPDAHTPSQEPPPQLLPETLRLLRENAESTEPEPLDDIAEKAGVKRRWLYMLAAQEIPNPGVVLVQRVYDYLARRGTARPVA